MHTDIERQQANIVKKNEHCIKHKGRSQTQAAPITAHQDT